MIFDVGMHKGEDAELCLKKGFRVVGIEANPQLCAKVHSRLDRFVNSGHLTIVNAAITRKSGPVTFYVNAEVSDWGTVNRQWVARNDVLGTHSSEITVEGVAPQEIMQQYGGRIT